jgi:long-chain acyl-CoA synthetase
MSDSVISLFDESVKRFNKRPSIQYFCKKQNKWVLKNWQELAKEVNKTANALQKFKIKPESCIAILSMTRPEWVIADIAIMKNASIVVPIYHSSLPDQIAYILNDAKAEIIFVENEEQLIKVRKVQQATGNLRVIIFDKVSFSLQKNEYYFSDFQDSNENFDTKNQISPIASLVYTSGTTGEPKGSMLSHDNLLYEALVIDKLGILSNEDVQLIFLPLAHIFARVLALAWIRTGHLLAFAQSAEKVIDDMGVVKPTFMAGVPRIFEKVRAKVIEKAFESPIKRQIIKLALIEAERLVTNPEEGLKTMMAKKFVFDKIGQNLKEKFGGRLRFLISGGAKLAPDVFIFFKLSGITICEGYGLTETTAASCLNLPWALRQGTVGRPVPGTEVRLDSDREILIRGRGVFLGFWQKPEQTKEVLDADGWFHTGDIGEIDNDGFVKIIDRKKDIIVTSQGKNISPQRVENLIKSKSPIIAHVVAVGDGKPYLSALIALDRLAALSLAFPNKDKSIVSMLELSTNQTVYQEVKTAIALANESLASFEQVKRFHILDCEFEVGVHLTPTLKVKRKFCVDKFKKEIKVLYE